MQKVFETATDWDCNWSEECNQARWAVCIGGMDHWNSAPQDHSIQLNHRKKENSSVRIPPFCIRYS